MSQLKPEHLRESASLCAQALRPHVDADWSVKAGCLEWSVGHTIVHMLGAMTKYTLYLASDDPVFIAIRSQRFDGASNAEVVASFEPVASALANVCGWVDPHKAGFHGTGPKTAADFLSIGCSELLIHTWDALQGFGAPFEPPTALVEVVLPNEYPDAEPGSDPWRVLIEASGRGFFR